MNITLLPALPEIFIAVMIIIAMLADAFLPVSKKYIVTMLVAVTLIIGFVIQLLLISNKTLYAFNEMFILDIFAYKVKLIIYVSALIALIYMKRYLENKQFAIGEFNLIYLFTILGMLVMTSANNLLVLYIGLELLSLSLYGLVALNRTNIKANEAAIKFFVLGALGSGLLLFGISFIYGATYGQLQLPLVLSSMHQLSHNSPLLIFATVFIIAGLIFKLGLVPFHMWVPDVYEGSPLAVVIIIGAVTKLAAVVFVIRFLFFGLGAVSSSWALMLHLVAVLSLFIGNIVAIAQKNIKRMLGYSAIANMGFVALGLITVNTSGLSATLFYTVVYVITSLIGFGVLIILSQDGYECENISDLKGLSKSHPLYAIILLFVMFSLAGIPPFAGFFAKFEILQALIYAGFYKTSIFAIIMSLIGTFYYLRIIKVIYFDDEELNLKIATPSFITKLILVCNVLLLLIVGFFPYHFINYWLEAFSG